MNQLDRFIDINNYVYDNYFNKPTIKDEQLKVESTRIVTKIALNHIEDKDILERIALFSGLEDKKSEQLLLDKANSLTKETKDKSTLTR